MKQLYNYDVDGSENLLPNAVDVSFGATASPGESGTSPFVFGGYRPRETLASSHQVLSGMKLIEDANSNRAGEDTLVAVEAPSGNSPGESATSPFVFVGEPDEASSPFPESRMIENGDGAGSDNAMPELSIGAVPGSLATGLFIFTGGAS
jgi:hypothetical protein